MKILWHELALRLQYLGHGAAAEQPAFGLQAVFGLLRGLAAQAGRHIAFHAVGKPLQRATQLRPGQPLEVELAFVLPPDEPPERFCELLWAHLSLPAYPWSATPEGAQVERQLHLAAPLADPGQETELDFLTLLPLTPSQLPFDAATLLEAVTRRFRQLFGADPGLPDAPHTLDLLGHLPAASRRTWHRLARLCLSVPVQEAARPQDSLSGPDGVPEGLLGLLPYLHTHRGAAYLVVPHLAPPLVPQMPDGARAHLLATAAVQMKLARVLVESLPCTDLPPVWQQRLASVDDARAVPVPAGLRVRVAVASPQLLQWMVGRTLARPMADVAARPQRGAAG